MGIFSRKPVKNGPCDLAELAMRRIKVLEAQMDQAEVLEKRLREIEAEWTDMYEKFRNLYARIRQRQAREAKGEEATPEVAPGIYNPLALRLLQGQHNRNGE